MHPKTAVLIDGDNLSCKHAENVLSNLGVDQQPDIARVFINSMNTGGWMASPGFGVVVTGTGKNATDIVLCIDAMTLALRDSVQHFAIASDDRDFTTLARKLRGLGCRVTGIGTPKAPAAFRAECSDFKELQAGRRQHVKSAKVTEDDRKIKTAIASGSAGGAGISVTELNAVMHGEHQFNVSEKSEKNWRAYLSARPALYDLDPRGPTAKVRFLPAGFA